MAEAEGAIAPSHGLCAPCLEARLAALESVAPSAGRASHAEAADAPEQDAA